MTARYGSSGSPALRAGGAPVAAAAIRECVLLALRGHGAGGYCPFNTMDLAIRGRCDDIAVTIAAMTDFSLLAGKPRHAFEATMVQRLRDDGETGIVEAMLDAGYPIARAECDIIHACLYGRNAKATEAFLDRGFDFSAARPYQISAALAAFSPVLRNRLLDSIADPNGACLSGSLRYALLFGLDHQARALMAFGVRLDSEPSRGAGGFLEYMATRKISKES